MCSRALQSTSHSCAKLFHSSSRRTGFTRSLPNGRRAFGLSLPLGFIHLHETARCGMPTRVQVRTARIRLHGAHGSIQSLLCALLHRLRHSSRPPQSRRGTPTPSRFIRVAPPPSQHAVVANVYTRRETEQNIPLQQNKRSIDARYRTAAVRGTHCGIEGSLCGRCDMRPSRPRGAEDPLQGSRLCLWRRAGTQFCSWIATPGQRPWRSWMLRILEKFLSCRTSSHRPSGPSSTES